MSDGMGITGGCLCGAVRYEAIGKPLAVAYCHCASCRRHTGAPVVAWVAYESEMVRHPTGQRKIYNSSPGVGRAFCEECGTPLTWEGNSRRFAGRVFTEFLISTLDAPHACVPDLHWFDSERIGWFDVSDDLPRYRELAGPAIGSNHDGPTVHVACAGLGGQRIGALRNGEHSRDGGLTEMSSFHDEPPKSCC